MIETGGTKTALVVADGIVIGAAGDENDIIGECFGAGVRTVLLSTENISHDFFDLSTRIAGEVLQKFTQYNFHVGIIGDIPDAGSRSLADFIRESNRTGQTVFAATVREALAMMKGRG